MNLSSPSQVRDNTSKQGIHHPGFESPGPTSLEFQNKGKKGLMWTPYTLSKWKNMFAVSLVRVVVSSFDNKKWIGVITDDVRYGYV